MQLNINSPQYYTNIFGVDDEIYWMCRELANSVKDKRYSEIIDTIGIVPIIAPREILDKGLCKEIKKCDIKYRFAHVSKQIQYEEYVNSNIERKKQLIVKNILESVNSIQKRAKLNYQEFKKDVLGFLDYTEEEIGVK